MGHLPCDPDKCIFEPHFRRCLKIRFPAFPEVLGLNEAAKVVDA